jgi:hypothetical protein
LSEDGEAGDVVCTVGGSGVVVSTWNERVAVAELFDASVALMRNVYDPSDSADDTVCVPLPGEQVPKFGMPVSTEHAVIAPCSVEYVKDGVVFVVGPDGPESIWTAGGVPSTITMSCRDVLLFSLASVIALPPSATAKTE